MWRQPKAVWAVAFASVIAFMGIGLVDPILKPIADQLNATPSQVSLLFTSYMAVMGLAMLITGVVSSRIGAKKTLLIGLVIIIVGAGLAGMSSTIGGIVGWRALWGLGNALFVATALATIVSSARGSVAQAIILYEAALGLGIAVGPLVGGILGGISWRGPFFGVSVLMAIALVVTAFLLPATPPARQGDEPRSSRSGRCGTAGCSASRSPPCSTTSGSSRCSRSRRSRSTWAPTRSASSSSAGGSAWPSPRSSSRPGCSTGSAPSRRCSSTSPCCRPLLAVMAIGTDNKTVLAVCVIVAGLFLGINNTLVTETVMKAAPVERGVASAAYSFVRFGGGAVAPWLAGKLGEEINVHVPFWVGAGAVLLGVGVLAVTRPHLRHIDAPETDRERGGAARGRRHHRRRRVTQVAVARATGMTG